VRTLLSYCGVLGLKKHNHYSRALTVVAVLAVLMPKGYGQRPADTQQGAVESTGATVAVPQTEKERAAEQLKQEQRQRILGVIPAFNSSDLQNAARLSPGQKFHLAFRSATDPFAFFAAGLDSAINQYQNDYAGYGQGMAGYAKRYAASYVDSFNGTMLGNALFPTLLHQDPRYFRKGTGSFSSRFFYAMASTVRCKGDSGNWQPSYSNILGNFAAGGISNLYYPAGDRGAGLTVTRALTVTAEGAIGALGYEFWPDIARKLARRHKP
jgi:hypothetical protein